MAYKEGSTTQEKQTCHWKPDLGQICSINDNLIENWVLDCWTLNLYTGGRGGGARRRRRWGNRKQGPVHTGPRLGQVRVHTGDPPASQADHGRGLVPGGVQGPQCARGEPGTQSCHRPDGQCHAQGHLWLHTPDTQVTIINKNIIIQIFKKINILNFSKNSKMFLILHFFKMILICPVPLRFFFRQ